MKKKVLSIICIALSVVLVILLGILVFQKFSGKVPSLFGYSLMHVETGSMEPEIHVGDCVIVKKVSVSELQVGDDITYNGKSGAFAGKRITHRIIDIREEENGKFSIQTQGIYQGSTPDPRISEEQVIGKVVVVSGFLGGLLEFFSKPIGFLVLAIPLVFIIIFEFINFKRTIKDENIDEINENDSEEK